MPEFGFISIKVKECFFDRKPVIDAVGRARVASLSRGGALVRKIMRNLMRRRKGVSQPGSAPNAHAGNLKELIFFAYDRSTESAVIGPLLFKDGQVPKLLQFGGTVTRKNAKGEMVRMTYKPRPYADVALKRAEPMLPGHWANSVRSA